MKRLLTAGVLAVTLITAALPARADLSSSAAPAGAGIPQPGRQTLTGVIDGAEFKVETPERWNGTLLIFSHPYYPAFMPDFPPGHGNRDDSQTWLLDHGYALAASDFKGRTGFVVKEAVEDQIGVLDWFEDHIGRPRRTVATGSSGGGAISLLLAERYPRRIDGVLAMCAPIDLYGQMNLSLDINFALKTLLAPGADIDLVRAENPAESVRQLQAVLGEAAKTSAGRARIALASAFGNVTGWNSAHNPKPESIDDQIDALVEIVQSSVLIFGAVGQADLAAHAGGNPSYNVGVDYRRQLIKSDQEDFVRAAYRQAGLALDKDLAALAAAPRIKADPAAKRWMERYAVPRGTTPSPVVTLHNTVDLAVADHERWYAGQVRENGDPGRLRQLFAARATHCAFSVAEEAVALRTLEKRIDTGRWPNITPQYLNIKATTLGPAWSKVFDFAAGGDEVRPPAFTSFRPTPPLRPSR